MALVDQPGPEGHGGEPRPADAEIADGRLLQLLDGARVDVPLARVLALDAPSSVRE